MVTVDAKQMISKHDRLRVEYNRECWGLWQIEERHSVVFWRGMIHTH